MTVLRARHEGRVYHVTVNDDGIAMSVAVMNINGVLRTYWRHWYLSASPRTREIIAKAGALR